MLGRAYGVSSRVMRGDQLGRGLGFPTANLEVSGLVLPPDGVYTAQATAGGKRHHAVVNIGSRPTITPEASATRLEAHLLDFDGDLYNRELQVVFVDRLRGEQRFVSREALQQQIQRDVTEARRRFG
jgi:riboflavin kinase/FMN adenylyltransferase